jgi:hypothetical protein
MASCVASRSTNTSLTNEHERGAAEWRRAIIAACAAVRVRVTDEECGWIVVCNVR